LNFSCFITGLDMLSIYGELPTSLPPLTSLVISSLDVFLTLLLFYTNFFLPPMVVVGLTNGC
jgi:hypothetical protein